MKLPEILLLLGALVAQSAAQDTTCVDGVYMIVARGSNEPPGTGRIGVIADGVANAVPNSKIQALDYPAVFTNYSGSVAAGVQALTNALTKYNAACPESKVALLGYSQGAQVTADTLCGTSEDAFNETFAISTSVVDMSVIAVVMMGDPTHITGLPWDNGTSTQDGIFPRENTTACEPYADKMLAYCDTGDVYCDRGSDRRVHGAYFTRYGTQAVDFIVAQFNESKKADEEASPTSTPTPTPTPTPGSGASLGPSAFLLSVMASAALLTQMYF